MIFKEISNNFFHLNIIYKILCCNQFSATVYIMTVSGMWNTSASRPLLHSTTVVFSNHVFITESLLCNITQSNRQMVTLTTNKAIYKVKATVINFYDQILIFNIFAPYKNGVLYKPRNDFLKKNSDL